MISDDSKSVLRSRRQNIFDYYSEAQSNPDAKSTQPIENNISRGLAIILEDSPFVLDRLIDLINDKDGITKVAKPQRADDFAISIQLSVDTYAKNNFAVSRIIGVTLAVDGNDCEIELVANKEKNSIPDIFIYINDTNDEGTVILIEVKRGDSGTAREQVRGQVVNLEQALLRYYKDENEDDKSEKLVIKTDDPIVSVTWEGIINILETAVSLGDNSRIIFDYIEHLASHYPDWFPAQKFSKEFFKEENSAKIKKRVQQLIENGNSWVTEEKIKENRTLRADATCMFVDENYFDIARWVYISPILNQKEEALALGLYIADTGAMSWAYFNKKNRCFDWLYNDKIIVDNCAIKYTVEPYLKFAHIQGKTVFNLHFNENLKKGIIHDSSWRDLGDSIRGTWKREDNWEIDKADTREDLLQRQVREKYGAFIDIEDFEKQFLNNFINSGRNQAVLSLGLYVEFYIPYDYIISLDNDNATILNRRFATDNNDLVAAFIYKAMNEFLTIATQEQVS